MGYPKRGLLTLLLACSPLLAQVSPDESLRQAFVLEQQGQFDKVIAMTKPLTESNQLSRVELGRACITLAVAYEGEGEFAQARNAFERSLRMFDHDPDHVVKPVERQRLENALTRVKQRVQLQEAFLARQEIASVLKTLQKAMGQDPYPQRFLAKHGTTDSVVSVSEIEWIEAADYYVCLHAGGKQHLLRESIKALEARLDPTKFVRLHRSAIVNIEYVREIHRDGRTDGWVLLSTGQRVRLNRTGWQRLLAMNTV